MLKNVYEGLNARPKVYLSKEYFCEMYPTCMSSKFCEFIIPQPMGGDWSPNGGTCLYFPFEAKSQAKPR